jgi:threonine dehydrogenase-like Zn-dependent dehydrogenase
MISSSRRYEGPPLNSNWRPRPSTSLLKVVRSAKLKPSQLVTHRFAMNDIMTAYDTFGNAAKEGALKVVLTNGGPR